MPKILDSQKNITITIKLTDDSEIKKLNKKYLKREFATDVLSFNMDQELDDGTYYLGDVVVNKNQAARQAKDYGNTYEMEVAELVAHGVLHLLGVHHADDDEKSVHGVKKP